MALLHRKSVPFAMASALIALLSLAACGGGGDDKSGGGTTATATRTQTRAATSTEEATGGSGGESTDTEAPTLDIFHSDGTGGASGGNSPEDVCALLTKDEVSRALGGASADGEATNTDPFFSCRWQTENFNDVSVELFVAPQDDREFYYSLTTDAEELHGTGNKAQYTDLIGLEVITDHYLVTVNVFDGDLSETDRHDLTLDLGSRVLGRLGD